MNKSNTENIDYPFGEAMEEKDLPLEKFTSGDYLKHFSIVETMGLSKEQLIKEKDKDRDERKYYKAFNLIFVCLCLIVCIYIFDCILYAVTGKSNENFTSVLEMLKALLFSLSGYLFAERNYKNQK